jgi:hypothetical protein
MKTSKWRAHAGEAALYPILIIALLVLFKAGYVSSQLSGSLDPFFFLSCVRNDLPIVGFVSFFCFTLVVVHWTVLKLLAQLFAMLCVVWFTLDFITIYLLNGRAPIAEIIRFAVDLNSFTDIALKGLLVLLPIVFVLWSKNFRHAPRLPELALLLSFLLMFVPSIVLIQDIPWSGSALPHVIGCVDTNP